MYIMVYLFCVVFYNPHKTSWTKKKTCYLCTITWNSLKFCYESEVVSTKVISVVFTWAYFLRVLVWVFKCSSLYCILSHALQSYYRCKALQFSMSARFVSVTIGWFYSRFIKWHNESVLWLTAATVAHKLCY